MSDLVAWINSHGVETIIAYLAFATLVGSMPPLPDGAGYWSRWGYSFLHMAAMNWRSALNLLKLPVPDETKKDG